MGTKTLTKKTLLLRERLKESLEQTKRRQMHGHVAPSAPVSAPEVTSSTAPAPVSMPVSVPTPETTSRAEAPQKELPPSKPAVVKPGVIAPAVTALEVTAPVITSHVKSTACTKDTSSKPVAKTPASLASSNILARLPKSTRTNNADGKAGNETGQKAYDPADKRFSRRKTTDLAGYVNNNGSTIKIPVIINDLSATGARFTLDRDSQQAFNTTPAIAEKFQLYIIYDRMYVSCRTQWRDGNSYGVRYLSAPKFF